jgi:hypothetical protein
MYPLSFDDTFSQVLLDLDYKLFLAAKAKGCIHCGGLLDTANYARKTRGMGSDNELRFSLCCHREGCRKRHLPRSVRFLGRRVYGAWVIIMAVDFCKELGLQGKIARQTIARWKTFWKAQLSEGSPFLQWARGMLPPGTQITDRPESLLSHFGFPARESWLPILNFFTQPL